MRRPIIGSPAGDRNSGRSMASVELVVRTSGAIVTFTPFKAWETTSCISVVTFADEFTSSAGSPLVGGSVWHPALRTATIMVRPVLKTPAIIILCQEVHLVSGFAPTTNATVPEGHYIMIMDHQRQRLRWLCYWLHPEIL